MYCPKKTCSHVLDVDRLVVEESGASQCTKCHSSICSKCKTFWHFTMTCGEYQRLPDSVKYADDESLFKIANSNNWKRCPECHIFIELKHGCNHMTCKNCGCEFCFQCLELWRNHGSGCNLWNNEDQLLEVVNRRAQNPAQRNAIRRNIEYNECVDHNFNRIKWLRGDCEVCGFYMNIFSYSCSTCRMLVCMQCRHNA